MLVVSVMPDETPWACGLIGTRAQPARSVYLRRGLLLGLRPGLRAGRRVHAAGAIGDPATNAERDHRAGAGRHEERRRGRGVPRAVPERLLDRRPVPPGPAARRGRRRARRDRGRGQRDLLPVLVVGAPLVNGNRVYNCAVVIHRGEVLGVAPKSYLPNYREFYERRWFAPGDDQPRQYHHARRRGGPVRSRPASSRATDVDGLVLHVEVCEDMWVPIPPSAEAALAGATVLANLRGSPITVARAEDRRLLVRSASARCSAAYLYAAAGQGESTHRPELGRPDDGLRVRRPAGRGGAVPGRRRATTVPTSTSTGCGRSGCGRAPSTTTGGRCAAGRRVPDRRVRASSRRPATSGCAARSTASRSCPTTRSGSRSTATRPTTSRSPASSSGCVRSASPRRSSASAADSTPRTR